MKIFRKHAGDEITFSEATHQIWTILPGPITQDLMDAYLDERFETYRGVPEFIEWCKEQGVLFMINTTGMQGYFQRVFAKKLLPAVTAVSACPMIHYPFRETDPVLLDLAEIQDKPRNTEAVMQRFGIPPGKIILMGDSGGDGPHFEWGYRSGAFLIGSMTKSSLVRYGSSRGIEFNFRVGPSYREGETRNREIEKGVDFMELVPHIEGILASR
jgi:hypothetical protein